MSLAAGAAGAGIVGTGVKAFGDYFSGQAQSNQFQYQAGVARANAILAKQDAIYATRVGEVEAQQQGMRGRAIVGRTTVGYGAGNISTATGSPSRVLSSETAITQANEGTVRANAAKRAYGFNVAAAEDTASAGALDIAAGTAKEASYMTMASTLIGGAGNVADKWLQAGQYFPGGASGAFS